MVNQYAMKLWKYLNICTLIPPLLPSSSVFKFISFSFHSTETPAKQRMLIIDTDAGFDDFVAMAALINDSHLSDTQSSFVSLGEDATISLCTPTSTSSTSNTRKHCNSKIGFISTVTGMQEYPSRSKQFFETNFPTSMVSVGRDVPCCITKPKMDWLIDYRAVLDAFLDDNVGHDDSHSNKNNEQSEEKSTTSNLNKNIESFLATQPNGSVDLMCIGPLTNVANWVTSPTTSSLLESKIRSVWIMGGNIPISTQSTSITTNNINPEFNFLEDPNSANVVLSSSVFTDKIFLVPKETCSDIPLDDETYVKIRQTSQSKGEGMISKVLQINDRTDPLRYDPLCTFAYLHPDMIELKPIDVNVDPKTGLVHLSDDRHVSQTIKFVTFVERFGKKGYLQWLLDLVENEK